MSQENKKIVRIERIQNWVVFLSLIGSLAFARSSWYLWLCVELAGLFIVVKRQLPRWPSFLTIIIILCLLYLPLSFWLLISPLGRIYGEELGALAGWFTTFLGAGVIAVVATIIELFRTSKVKRTDKNELPLDPPVNLSDTNNS